MSYCTLHYVISVLDEATSQVGLEMERRMYNLCAELGISLLSVGHRDSLRQYHHIELNFDGQTGWAVRPIVNPVTQDKNPGAVDPGELQIQETDFDHSNC